MSPKKPGCSSKEFLAPEKVYIINKNTAGDLQIGLEIITPGVDLDLFLLADDCGKITCLKSSKNNNQDSNNEGIILEDAPIGTYYIVVEEKGLDRAETTFSVLVSEVEQVLATPISFGERVDGEIQQASQVVSYSFSLSETALVYFDALD